MSATTCLVFAPHFDDETLACGATLHRLCLQGQTVVVCGLTWSEKAFSGREDLESRVARSKSEASKALDLLGVSRCIYPDDFWLNEKNPQLRTDMHLQPQGSL